MEYYVDFIITKVSYTEYEYKMTSRGTLNIYSGKKKLFYILDKANCYMCWIIYLL